MGVVGDPVEHLSDLTKVLILEKIFAFWDDGATDLAQALNLGHPPLKGQFSVPQSEFC